jgi:sortase A
MKPFQKLISREPITASTFLRWAQYCFLLAGTLALVWFGYIQAETLLFQAYQNWRFDQLQKGKPASVALYVEQWIPIPWKAEVPPNLSSATPRRKRSAPLADAEGDLIGKLVIPRLNLSAIVLEGIDTRTLRLAVGHLPGTPLPGDSGNVDLAAHRDTFFRRLNNIHQGDLVTVSTLSGTDYSYRVETIAIVTPDNTSVLNSSPGPGLNLITCYPFDYVGPAPRRFVVHASQVSALAGRHDVRALRHDFDQEREQQSNRILAASLAREQSSSAHHSAKRLGKREITADAQRSLIPPAVSEASLDGEEATSATQENYPREGSSTPDAKTPKSHTNPLRTFIRKLFKRRT